MKLAKLKHLPCFTHTLNLVDQKDVATLAAIQIKVKAIVAHFHCNTVAAEKLYKVYMVIAAADEDRQLELPISQTTTGYCTV